MDIGKRGMYTYGVHEHIKHAHIDRRKVVLYFDKQDMHQMAVYRMLSDRCHYLVSVYTGYADFSE